MNRPNGKSTSRRTFLKNTGYAAAASALASVAAPRVHAADDGTLRLALIGCGSRGTGAAANALSVQNGPIKLIALGDVFPERLTACHAQLSKSNEKQVDVPEERRFVGLDCYRKAMDCLRPGDVAIFATPPAFRWVHFAYAIQKGLNVFMEKPVTVDGPTTKRMIKLAEEADAKNLKVAVGLMWRHCNARKELVDRVRQGEIGDIISMRTYRMHGPIGFFNSGPKPEGISDLLYQVQRFHSFLWASGGAYSDFYIHNIDEMSWLKDAWPVEAQATGGRHYRGDSVDQNFDNYSVEYTYPDGAKLFMIGRCIAGCHDQFDGYAHGSKGLAQINDNGGPAGTCRIYRGQNPTKEALAWRDRDRSNNSFLPYVLEWNDFIAAIREDRPYNEVKRGAEASLVSSMGRMAAHTGRIITWDDMLNCPHEFAPGIDKFTADSPAPVQPNAQGKYPVPQPGLIADREY
jgi:predicted dehydrogenase